LHCPKCGVETAEGDGYCRACGLRLADAAGDEAGRLEPARTGAGQPIAYAGFWLRAVAYVLDSMLLGFLVGIFILGPLMQRAGISPDNPWEILTSNNPRVIAMKLLATMASWLYWALLESSAWQATLGKRALGLQVTDLAGQRVSFARASGRYFGKIISGLLFLVGFVMAGFTEKKQGLHDMLAGCLVRKKV